MEIVTLVAYLLVTLFMAKCHVSLLETGSDTVTRVAEKFAVQSHKLIEKGVMIDLMPYSFDKHEKFTEWTFELHEYLDDFESELQAVAGQKKGILIFRVSSVRHNC